MKKFHYGLFGLLLYCYAFNAHSLAENTSLWIGFAEIGPTHFAKHSKYYFDAQIEFIDTRYKLEEAYASVGIGQEYKNWLFFIVNTVAASKSFSGHSNYEDKLYEEANFRKTFNQNSSYAIRSRLEERKRFSEKTINLRLRERLMFRFPFKRWANHFFVIYDEMFFNLNRPDWVIDKFLVQNRAFIGINKVLSKKSNLDIGYLNRLLFGDPKRMINTLVINFNFTGKSDYIEE